MQIERLMEKTEQVQYALLVLLQDQLASLPVKDVMKQTGLSKVTLYKYIEALNTLFENNHLDAYLILEDNELSFYQGPEVTRQELLQPFLDNAIKYHIMLYLFHKEHFTIQKLAQDLLVSDATLNRHLASLNRLLAEFGLSIVQGHLKGPEHQRRYFYYDLFLKTLPKEKLIEQIRLFDSSRAVLLVERLCAVTLDEEKASRLQLWFSISQQRLRAQRKDFKDLDNLLSPYAQHIFFQRLERAVLHYFSQFAVEFDRGEAEALFAFLSSQFILPVQTIEYILGFGGPIPDIVTEAISLLRQNGLIQGKTNEQVIYVLGQLVAQSYFFSGAVESSALSDGLETPFLAQLSSGLTDMLGQLHQLISPRPAKDDLSKRLYMELMKFIIFLQEQAQTQLIVGVDTGGNPIEQALLTTMLGQTLENNRLIQLKTYQSSECYDCIISQRILGDYGQTKVYRLKHQFSRRELSDLSSFLRQALKDKNRTIPLS